MFSNNIAAAGVLRIWALSSLPTAAAALSWDICAINESGVKTCQSRIPRGARIAIAVGCLMVLLLLISLVFCILKNRRATKASEQEYNVEASQVDGPPTIIATEYHPNSGPSGVYSGSGQKPSGHGTGNTTGRMSPQMSGPTYPVAAHQYYPQHYPTNIETRTAPVSQPAFPDQPYPFTGYSPRTGTMPKTAFVSGGFPRPLLAGNRLKDRLKERPSSVSSMAMSMPGPPPTR